MADAEIRVGLIGAGGNVRNRHIPGFQKINDLEIIGVANRSLESGRSVADQFNIPRVYNGWQELLEDDESTQSVLGPGPTCTAPLLWRRWTRESMCSPRPGWPPPPRKPTTCWTLREAILSWSVS